MTRMYNPPHPGVLLREYLPAGQTVTGAAKILRIPPTRLARILRGTSDIDADMAVRLAKWFDTSQEFWLNMQNLYDLWHAERALGKRFNKIPVLVYTDR